MVCYHPLIMHDIQNGRTDKKQLICLGSAEQNRKLYDEVRHLDHYYIVPCGQCIGCRLERSRQWAIRISQ